MNFSGYLPLHEDTSTIDFGPDRLIRLAVHGPKVGHNELDCACVFRTEIFRCYRYSAFTIRGTLADLVFLRDSKLVPLCRLLPHLLMWVLL